MELTKKHMLYLKKLAHHTPVTFHIGKNGITENTIKAVSDYLKAHEYMKIKVNELPEDITIKDMAKEISEKTSSILVQTLGHTIVLFKRNPQNVKIRFDE